MLPSNGQVPRSLLYRCKRLEPLSQLWVYEHFYQEKKSFCFTTPWNDEISLGSKQNGLLSRSCEARMRLWLGWLACPPPLDISPRWPQIFPNSRRIRFSFFHSSYKSFHCNIDKYICIHAIYLFLMTQICCFTMVLAGRQKKSIGKDLMYILL